MGVVFAFVRLERVANLSELSRLASHGRRLDPSALRRVDPSRTASNLAFSRYAEDPLDLVAAWNAATAFQGASVYGRAPVAAHLLVGVSPSLVDEAGDRHDPSNPVNSLLVAEAVAWANATFGEGSVIAGRLDVDEHGGGVVDLVLVPVRNARMNGRSSKRIISVSKVLDEIHAIYPEEETTYGALQSSWSSWARRIDPRIRRGTPKATTDRHHVHADVYRYVAASREAEIREKYDTDMRAALAEIETERESLASRSRAVDAAREELEQHRVELDEWWHDLDRYKTELASESEASRDAVERAMREGVRAFLDGRIDRIDGSNRVVLSPSLAEADRAELTALVRAGWRSGLREVLIHLRDTEPFGRQRARTTYGL